MVARYVTDLASVIVPRAVRIVPPPAWPSFWITQTPLLEQRAAIGLAHLTPAGAASIARAKSGRLPTAAEMLALHLAAAAASSELAPFTMPDPHYQQLGYKPGAPEMMSRDWIDYADAIVMARIAALGDLGDRSVANAGKSWNDPPGSLCGWWVPNVAIYGGARSGPGFIQEGGHVVHDPGFIDANGVQQGGQSDYGTSSLIVWDEPGVPAAEPES